MAALRRVSLYTLVAVGVLVLLRPLVSWLEPRLTFFPSTGETATPATVGLRYETLRIRTSDGEQLGAWWLDHGSARADIIYFHGNGGNLSIWLPAIASVHARGAAVLAFDYRGYGLSTGTPTEAGLYRDADAVLEAYRAMRRTRPVIYWGRSLGGAVAAYAASRHAPDGLILESAFVDKRAVLAGSPVLRALDRFARYRFDAGAHLRGYRGPSLVLHAEADSVVPYAAGRALHDAIPGPKRFVVIPSGDHNDLQPDTATAYWGAIDDFLASVSRTPPGPAVE